MYERGQHRLLPWPAFLRRAARHLLWAALIIACAVVMGTVGYHGVPWAHRLFHWIHIEET